MIPPKVIAAVVFIWVTAALIGGFYELSYLGSTEQALINKVLFYDVVTTEGSWGIVELPGVAMGYMTNFWKLATFQFSFITGDYEIVRWFIFAPLTAMVVYGMVMTVIGILRGTL